tara:strand:- start:1034 stop:1426 length:393 start_codon:yes stop_codon:yes gene_type:complete
MSAQTLLSVGNKWYSYSGTIQGGVGAPASISLILVPNSGLRDSFISLQPFFGPPVATGTDDALGIIVYLDDQEIYRQQNKWENDAATFDLDVSNKIELFIPRQSKLEVQSLNTSNNNSQLRGCNLIGYFL